MVLVVAVVAVMPNMVVVAAVAVAPTMLIQFL